MSYDDELAAQEAYDLAYDRMAELVYETYGEDLNGMDEMQYRRAIRYTKDYFQGMLLGVLDVRIESLKKTEVVVTKVQKMIDDLPSNEEIRDNKRSGRSMPFLFECSLCEESKPMGGGYPKTVHTAIFTWAEGGEIKTNMLYEAGGLKNMPVFCKECMDTLVSQKGKGVIHGVDSKGCPVIVILDDSKHGEQED